MKNILIAGSTLLLFTITAEAQSASVTQNDEKALKQETSKTGRNIQRNNNEASYQSKQAFLNDFGNVKKVSWKVTPMFDEATFINNKGKRMKAYYDFDSRLVGTTTKKSFKNIPAKAQEYIHKHYSKYTPGAVILFDDNENNETDMELYGLAFNDEDNYFVSLKKGNESIIVKVNMDGEVFYFKKL